MQWTWQSHTQCVGQESCNLSFNTSSLLSLPLFNVTTVLCSTFSQTHLAASKTKMVLRLGHKKLQLQHGHKIIALMLSHLQRFGFAGCTYECNARLGATELTVTCTVNGQEDTLASITYQVNGKAAVNGKWSALLSKVPAWLPSLQYISVPEWLPSLQYISVPEWLPSLQYISVPEWLP